MPNFVPRFGLSIKNRNSTFALQNFSSMENWSVTVRETEILRLVGKGKSSKEIATQLSISNYTVETHRKNILKKLRAKNMIEALRTYNRMREYYQLPI